ncbi:hypothetical protein X777_02300 [Ooceraea biroi]|uniref:Uncharacterized protein n=1 Tax=Ooceraea biroi TaxID=2015173 RepID=A0A026WM15_OOCBI|nr:hypothetical protein X777_02300 [Ooceraea biroi]
MLNVGATYPRNPEAGSEVSGDDLACKTSHELGTDRSPSSAKLIAEDNDRVFLFLFFFLLERNYTHDRPARHRQTVPRNLSRKNFEPGPKCRFADGRTPRRSRRRSSASRRPAA